jgi:DNA-directed RNA polymerase subunit RPC12/RpoP
VVPLNKADLMPECPRCRKRMSLGTVAPPARGLPDPDAPLVTKVKADARHFVCVCGERVILRGEVKGRTIRCLACTRDHVVEIEAPPKPAPKPRAAGPTLHPGEFLCECGEVQPPRTSRTGRSFTCKRCGRAGHVEIQTDPKSGAVTVRAVVTSGPKTAAPPKPVASDVAWKCACGQPIDAKLVMAQKAAACPACGRLIEAEKTHPRTGMTQIRPRIVEPQGPRTSPCACGAQLEVPWELVGRSVQCPECGAKMTVEVRDGAPALRPI